MFRIITPSEYVTSPWRNGGGVTHQIARDGGVDTWRWRLSIAEVASDGPFSQFEGMSRILTVIDGAGIDLHTPDGVLSAMPLLPLSFSGDLPVESRMVNGPIRDLNVIYDPCHIAARVTVIKGPATIPADPDLAGFVCLSGSVTVTGASVTTGSCALGRLDQITVASGAIGILVTLRPVQTAASSPATA